MISPFAMSTTTYWLVFGIILILDWPLKIIRWPLSLTGVVGISVYHETSDGWKAIIVAFPLLIVCMVISRTIKMWKETSKIINLNR